MLNSARDYNLFFIVVVRMICFIVLFFGIISCVVLYLELFLNLLGFLRCSSIYFVSLC